MIESTNTPRIRFKGYTEAWEQRKLGEVGKAQSGVGFPDSEQGGKSGIPFFKVSDMNTYGNESEMITANHYVNEEQIAAHSWKPISNLPAMFFAKVGAAVMLNRKRLCRFPFLLDNNTMAYSLDRDVWDSDFAKALFETLNLTSLVQVGALPSYNACDVESMQISLPRMNEQQQIGVLFRNLDNLITLHQRKYDKFSQIKEALLEKMFPQEGETVPQIRFKGFTETWEQRKLGEIYNFSKGKGLSLDTFYKGIQSPAIAYGHLYTQYKEVINTVNLSSNEDAPLSKKGDILFPGSSTVPYGTAQSNAILLDNIKLGGDIIIARAIDEMPHAPFISYQINAKKEKLFPITVGTTITHMYGKDLAGITYSFPEIKEQVKIGTLFSKLDNLITLHQRKYDKLVSVKRSLLEKMLEGGKNETIVYF